MSPHPSDFNAALKSYLHHLVADRHRAVPETALYGHLQNLLNAASEHLSSPKVYAMVHPADSGAGIPDLGLMGEHQAEGTKPEHGVIEVKPTTANVEVIAQTEQVQRYVRHYGVVLVTNYYQFLLVTRDDRGEPLVEEQYQMAGDENAFWLAAEHPRQLARTHGPALLEYLMRVMRRTVPLETPQELARILASYAREAKARIESGGGDFSTLQNIRTQLEDALGLHFDESRGEAFFRSSLVQTLFYGIFSAWVLWHEEQPTRTDNFDLWRDTRDLSIPALLALNPDLDANYRRVESLHQGQSTLESPFGGNRLSSER